MVFYAEDSNKLIIKKTLPNTPVNSNTLIPIVCIKPLPKTFIALTDQQDKNAPLRNNKVTINIEKESKATTESNNGLAINVKNKDNDMEIDLFVKETRPIKNANTNSVEINVRVKDKSTNFSKGTVNVNDMIVDKNDDNDMDTSQSSDPPGEFVDIYANDNNKDIVPHNNLVYGRFSEDFEPHLTLKINEVVNHNIPFLITTPYIHQLDIDQNTAISLDKVDIKKFDSDVYMGDGVVYCFFRWMSLQSSKITVIDSSPIELNELTDAKAIKLREKISTQNLILIPIAKDGHWIIYLFIRSSEKSFMLILLDSLRLGLYSNCTKIVTKWFKSSEDVKGNDITLSLEYINLPHNIRQYDGHSCASFVCLYSYIASMLSDEYRTKNN